MPSLGLSLPKDGSGDGADSPLAGAVAYGAQLRSYLDGMIKRVKPTTEMLEMKENSGRAKAKKKITVLSNLVKELDVKTNESLVRHRDEQISEVESILAELSDYAERERTLSENLRKAGDSADAVPYVRAIKKELDKLRMEVTAKKMQERLHSIQHLELHPHEDFYEVEKLLKRGSLFFVATTPLVPVDLNLMIINAQPVVGQPTTIEVRPTQSDVRFASMLSIKISDSHGSNVAFLPESSQSGNSATITFCPASASIYKVEVRLYGQHVGNSPLTLTVSSSSALPICTNYAPPFPIQPPQPQPIAAQQKQDDTWSSRSSPEEPFKVPESPVRKRNVGLALRGRLRQAALGQRQFSGNRAVAPAPQQNSEAEVKHKVDDAVAGIKKEESVSDETSEAENDRWSDSSTDHNAVEDDWDDLPVKKNEKRAPAAAASAATPTESRESFPEPSSLSSKLATTRPRSIPPVRGNAKKEAHPKYEPPVVGRLVDVPSPSPLPGSSLTAENGKPDLAAMFEASERKGIRGCRVAVLGTLGGDPSDRENCFNYPLGCRADPKTKDWLVCDTKNNVVKVFSEAGKPKQVIPSDWRKELWQPSAVLTLPDSDDLVIKDDKGIFVYSRNGEKIRELAKMRRPLGLGLDGHGRVVTLADASSGAGAEIQIYDVRTGEKTSRFEFSPKETMTEQERRNSQPRFLDVSGDTLAVTDLGIQKVFLISLKDGRTIHSFGELGRNPGQFSYVSGIQLDSRGNMVIGDAKGDRVQVFDASGKYLCPVKLDPPGAPFVSDICLTEDGHLLTSLRRRHAVVIYKLQPEE